MTKLEKLNLSRWDFSKSNVPFHTLVDHSTLKTLNVSNSIFSIDMSDAFYLTNLEELDLTGVDTSKTKNMTHLFYYSKMISIDISDFDMQNVEQAYGMFAYSSIERLDMSNMDTRILKDMSYLCMYCSNLKYVNLNNIGSDEMLSVSDMFYGANNIEEIYMKNFNFGKVNHIGYSIGPFHDKSKLRTIDLSGSKMTSVTYLGNTFRNNTSLEELDLSNIDAPKAITNADTLFANDNMLNEIDLSSFDFSQLGSGVNMFQNVPATTVYVKDQANVDKLSSLSGIPSTMTFVIKP